MKNESPTDRWRLWIDGCGGYLLLTGDCWTIGGVTADRQADICVHADLPRTAGTILRSEGDFFWSGVDGCDQREFLSGGQELSVRGSARITFHQPSSLCQSAVLKLAPPHRFDQHVDGVILVHETLLVGPGQDCHIRCRQSSHRIVLLRRANQWLVKLSPQDHSQPLLPGQRKTLQDLTMTLEEV